MKRFRRVESSALMSVVVWGFCTFVSAQTDMVIYDDARQNGWEYWGWATSADFNQSSVVHSGSKAMAVTMGGSHQAVYLFHGAMDTRFYTDLNFWIHGGTTGGQELKVIGRLNGVSQPAVNLEPLTAGTWQQMVIPLTDLGVAGSGNFSELWIQDRTGSAKPTFYLDDMKLIGAPLVTTLPVSISVNAGLDRHPINPMIYGVNFASASELNDLNATLNRSGGNAQTRYNWQDNCHNRAADWYFLSSSSGPDIPGEHSDEHIQDTKNGGAEPLITVPMIGRAPKLGANRSSLYSFSVSKYGAQTAVDPWNSEGGNGISAATGQPIVNDPDDANFPVDSTFQQGWIEHMTNTWGVSTNGGVRYYCMDNEPSLWDNTHRDIHPVEPTMEELWGLYQDYGKMIKTVDPGALLIAPEDGSEHTYSDKDTYGGGMEFIPWLLQQSSLFEVTNGYRLLDMCSVHYYPPSFHSGTSIFEQRQRNRNTRAMWDPEFIDSTYARKTDQLGPKIKGWSDTYYPGTPVGITEYNWGAEDHINGATAQADIWGIFGREGLDFATRWTTPDAGSMVFNALKMYRNYDGSNSAFGDMSISSAGSVSQDDVSTFAAIRGADHKMTIMVINKHLTATAPTDITLTNYLPDGPVEVWQLTSANSINRLSDLSAAGEIISTTLPPQSITLFVVSGLEVPPVIRDPKISGGTDFEFWLDGQAGQQISVEGSTNLFDWWSIQTNILTTNSLQVFLPTTMAYEFFRVLWLP